MSNTRLKSRRRQDQGNKWARISIAILSTIGLIDTGTITLNRWGVIGNLSCPGGIEGCDKVLNSPWGTVFESSSLNLPLSFLGFVSYFLVLILSISPFISFLKDKNKNIATFTWWSLFYLSCVIGTFSLLLIGIMIFKIKAICLFCILSAILSISIFFLTLIGGGFEDYGDIVFKGIILFLITSLVGLIWSSSVDPNKVELNNNAYNSPPLVRSESSAASIELANFLTNNGAIMYFAYWCKYCALQKELFGQEAVQKLNTVECAEDGLNSQNSLCKEKGISSYPSWEIDGKIIEGATPLEELANLIGYKGNRDF
tara:strand:- start:209 stop:1150 length:942 start_codon:yes stop_codon:yes gene_type:complete